MNKKLVIYQDEFPAYRSAFFDCIYNELEDRLTVLIPELGNKNTDTGLKKAYVTRLGRNIFLPGAFSFNFKISFVKLNHDETWVLLGSVRSITSLILLLRIKIFNLPIYWWGHLFTNQSPHTFLGRLKLYFLKFVGNNILYSQSEVDLAKKNKIKCISINNSIDTRKIFQNRKKFNIRKRRENIFIIGRNTEKFNFPLLAELARKAENKFHFHWIGCEASELIQLCNGADMSNITVYGHTYDEKLIGAVANKCTIGFFPGDVGLSLLHMMAYGLPICVHNSGRFHMPEFSVVPGSFLEIGMFFERGSTDSAFETLCQMSDSEQLSGWSDNSYDIIKQGFSSEIMAKKFLDFVDI